MAERIRALLDYIVRHYAVVDQVKDVDLNAPVTESGGDIAAEKEEEAAREWARAEALAEPFQQGLTAAWRARQRGETEIALDDRIYEQNAQADALIGFLVSFDLAESRSEQSEPRHYIYHIAVNWDALAGVARAAGVDLFGALAQASK